MLHQSLENIKTPVKSAMLALVLVFAPAAWPEAQTEIPAPEFELADSSGLSFHFPANLDGPTIVLFWASWCPYCKALMPHLQSIVDEYQGQIPVLALNFRDDEDPAEYLAEYGYDFRVFPLADEVANLWGVKGTPGLFLVDGSGRILFSNFSIPEDTYPSDPADEIQSLKHYQKAARKAPFWAAQLRLAIDKVRERTADDTIIDLTHAYDADTVYWPTAPGFELEIDFKGMTDGGWYYEANTFRSAEHGGTHLDAPIHFAEGKQHADEIPLDRLIGPAVVVDVSAHAAANRDYQVSVDDFKAWEAVHGELPEGIIVLLHTGFGKLWPDRVRYMGTDERGADAVALLHFPGLHPDAAAWLVENRSIHAIGLDTPSIDYGQSEDFNSHRILFEHNIPAFENVANLERLPKIGFEVIALPMKIRGGSGGPLRIVAILP